MTYRELHEAYKADPQAERDAVFLSWDVPTRMAWRVIQEFTDRRGFGAHWHEIGDDCQDEIFYAIKSIVTRESDKSIEVYYFGTKMLPKSGGDK